jgi:phosphoribosylformylglycinamidine synthase subunit PurSL
MLYCVELIPHANAIPHENETLSREAHEFFGSENARAEIRPLYLLQFDADAPPAQANHATMRAAQRLFRDPVAHDYRGGPLDEFFGLLENETSTAYILAAYRPGVTDAEGESAVAGYRIMAAGGDESLPYLERVRSCRAVRLETDKSLNPAQLIEFARRYLINDLVQDCMVFAPGAFSATNLVRFAQAQFNFDSGATGKVKSVPLRDANDETLLKISKDGLLALNLDEMKAIQAYYKEQGRDPVDIELETLAQTWSEHCVHKTFKALIKYTGFDHEGNQTEQYEVNGLFKSYIAEPTMQLKKSWIVSAFVDNAGIIAFDKNHDLSFKVETHNHPSALEPFGGANTGLGGVIRDVMAVSAKPIAATDIFCFGEPSTPAEKIPADVLPPHRIFQGVVDGVRDYGNKMGIPTVNGAILFDRDYIANPLVYCGTVGFAPHGSHPRNPQTGDRIIVVGGRTGRDGIHGATFSSIELGGDELATENSKAASVVQIGNPIEQKKVLDMLLKARDAKLYHAITDCGAGGLSSAIGEMGAELGAKVELGKVPLKYAGLEPWEIWVSEAQERMVLAVPPENLAALEKLCQIEGVEMTDLGEFTDDHWLTLLYNGAEIGKLQMEFLHHGLPRRTMTATWHAPAPRPQNRTAHSENGRPAAGFGTLLRQILADPNIASKESVIRVYDHEVLGNTVVKPLVGVQNDGPGDAAVLKPLPNSNRGVVISNGINPRYGLIDPYHMAACAIDEAIRNAVAVGANLERMALLDNFCWGNPNVPERLGELTRAARACNDYALAFKLPFISGKDSLNNEFKDPATGERIAIPGTLLISAIAVLEDITRATTMDLKRAGNLLYLVGKTKCEMGGSYYYKYNNQLHGDVPKVEAPTARRTFTKLSKAISDGLVQSCHDLSEGGLAVAAAEMALAGGLGVRLDLTRVQYSGQKADKTNAVLLFSETPSRFLVEVAPEQRAEFEASLDGVTFANIGTVIEDDEFNIMGLLTSTIIRMRVSELKRAWQTPIFS